MEFLFVFLMVVVCFLFPAFAPPPPPPPPSRPALSGIAKGDLVANVVLRDVRLKRSKIEDLPRSKFDGNFAKYQNGFEAPKKVPKVQTLQETAKLGSIVTVLPDGTQKLHLLSVDELKVFRKAADAVKEERANAGKCVGCRPFVEDRPVVSEGKEDVKPIQPRSRTTNTTAILGADTRTEVRIADWFPAHQCGLLTFTGGRCSAALIGPRHILTAGHCVHQGDGGSWYGNFRFYPARTSLSTFPYTSYGWSSATTYRGWADDGDTDWDIALIKLSFETTFGWMSFGWSSSISTSWYIYHKGYPKDKTYGSMWSSSGYISDVDSQVLWTKTTDTVGGQSGGPWYRYLSSNPVIYAAHSGSSSWWFFGWHTENRHTRITSGVFNDLCSWIADARVC